MMKVIHGRYGSLQGIIDITAFGASRGMGLVSRPLPRDASRQSKV